MMNKTTIDADVFLSDEFRKLSPSSKSLYMLLYLSADECGLVRNAYKLVAEDRYTGQNLDALVRAGFILAFTGDDMLVADYFRHSGKRFALAEDHMDDYEKTTYVGQRFVPCELANKITKKAPTFIPPTLEEVKAYARERKSSVDPVAFYTYFSRPNENGETWVDAKGAHVRNWKQKFCTWERLGGGNGRSTEKHTDESTKGNPQGVSRRFNIVPAVDGRAKG